MYIIAGHNLVAIIDIIYKCIYLLARPEGNTILKYTWRFRHIYIYIHLRTGGTIFKKLLPETGSLQDEPHAFMIANHTHKPIESCRSHGFVFVSDHILNLNYIYKSRGRI